MCQAAAYVRSCTKSSHRSRPPIRQVRSVGLRGTLATCTSCCSRCRTRSSTRPPSRCGCRTVPWPRLPGTSIAHHHVAVADLILVQHDVGGTVSRLLREHRPEVVGLSVMTFQRGTARTSDPAHSRRSPVVTHRGGRLRSEPRARGVGGRGDRRGCHRSRRRRRDIPRSPPCVREVTGISVESAGCRTGRPRGSCAIRRGPSSHLGDSAVKPPKRSARVLQGYTLLGRPVDVVETSRGCTYDCSFCSIIEMRGRNFHTWPIGAGHR